MMWTVQSACFALCPARHTLALCQNGIQFHGSFYVPWQRIARRISRHSTRKGIW
jgi:hypothetical protein